MACMRAVEVVLSIMVTHIQCLFFCVLVVGAVWSSPVFLEPDSHLSELRSQLVAHAQREDARLPLPTPQDLEAVKKVAQVLIMLGEQIIPTIIGEPPSAQTSNCEPAVVDVPNDLVNSP